MAFREIIRRIIEEGKKEAKPPQYSNGPFSKIFVVPSGKKWHVYTWGVFPDLNPEDHGEFDEVEFRAEESIPSAINTVMSHVLLYYYEPEPEFFEEYTRGTPNIRGGIPPYYASIIQFSAKAGYAFWAMIYDERLGMEPGKRKFSFIVWVE